MTYVTGVFLSASPVFFFTLLCPTVKEIMPPRIPDVTVFGLRTSRLCQEKPSEWIRNQILPTGSTSLFTEETLPGVCRDVFLWSSLALSFRHARETVSDLTLHTHGLTLEIRTRLGWSCSATALGVACATVGAHWMSVDGMRLKTP